MEVSRKDCYVSTLNISFSGANHYFTFDVNNLSSQTWWTGHRFVWKWSSFSHESYHKWAEVPFMDPRLPRTPTLLFSALHGYCPGRTSKTPASYGSKLWTLWGSSPSSPNSGATFYWSLPISDQDFSDQWRVNFTDLVWRPSPANPAAHNLGRLDLASAGRDHLHHLKALSMGSNQNSEWHAPNKMV